MNKVIDILGIILPALIIVLCITRVFFEKVKGANTLTLLFAIILLLVGIVRYFEFSNKSFNNNDSKTSPISVSRHSAAFNSSLEDILIASDKMNEAFQSDDMGKINTRAKELQQTLDSLKVDELKVDSLIYQTALQPYLNTKAEISSIIADSSINEKRGSLNIFYNELFTLLSTVRYDIDKLYWLECDKAFGVGKPGNWLSKSENSMNPYGQKNCSELKTTLNFVQSDTTKKQ